MSTVEDDGHRLPPCDVPACEGKAVAKARSKRVSDISRIATTDGVPEQVALCIHHFDELVGMGARP